MYINDQIMEKNAVLDYAVSLLKELIAHKCLHNIPVLQIIILGIARAPLLGGAHRPAENDTRHQHPR